MKEYLKSYYLRENDISNGVVQLKDLKKLIRNDYDLDIEILNQYPIAKFGALDETLRIAGSKDILEAYEKIDNVKMDLTYTFKDIEFIGFTDKSQIILNFLSSDDQSLTATGIYDFTNEFLDEIFHMGKYTKFCMEMNSQDLIEKDVTELMKRMKDIEKQYRFIMHNEDTFLRGYTSTKYKNYDNNIALYLTLLALHKYSKENNVEFKVEKIFLSDSSLNAIFEQKNPVIIPDVGKVYFGAVVSNDETRDKKLSFEIRYRIVDPQDNKNSFAAIPANLKDTVFKFNHTVTTEKLIFRLEDIFRLKEIQNTMMEYIKKIKTTSPLSNDVIYVLMMKITHSRDFQPETRSTFKKLYDENLVNNTYTLMQIFNKVNNITTDLDERICLERIYHDLIMQIIK